MKYDSYWKLDRHLSIWSHLLWWKLLYLSVSLPSDIHHSHTDRWDYVSSCICSPAQKEWTGLHEILQSCSENYDNQQPTFFTHHSIYGLRESSTERNPLSMSWNYHQRLLFPLYIVYMAQSTDDRSTNSIPGQRGHHNIITQWIERDHTVWNHFNTEGPRTTNHIEAWHGKVKKKVQHLHPNIYTIIQAFKDIQASSEIHRLQLQAGGTHQGSTETSTAG